MSENRETVVVSNGGMGGYVLAAVILIGAIVLGTMAYQGYFSNEKTVSLELKVPEIPAPANN